MVVSVVQIGDMRMGVHERLVGVAMGVRTWAVDLVGMGVAMMVVVLVLVDMLDHLMGMRMLVIGADEEDHAQRGDRRRDQLAHGGAVAEHDPGDEHAHERRRGEDQLSVRPRCRGPR